jgi:L,D-transpeptidase catalytic domain
MRLSRAAIALAAALASMTLAAAARADVLITIDKSTQRMTVEEDGALLYTWPVSTGAPGYDTPSGEFKPFRMERDHFSREWDDAPMPHSIFFTREGHAIHGSGHLKAIGTPASHGCVRLEPKNATVLFDLVKHEGMSHTQVVLTGETPEKADAPVAHRNQDKRNATVVASEDDDAPVAPLPRRHARSLPRSGHYTRYYYYWPRRYYYARPFYPFGW